MKNESNERVRAHYEALRGLDCATLWDLHVSAFDTASPQERNASVSLIRAVAVVFATRGTAPQKEQARIWVRGLLEDPSEKIRRYAVQALPKLGVTGAEEEALLGLWEKARNEREHRVVNQTLERVGGRRTLERAALGTEYGKTPALHRVEANIARSSGAGLLALDAPLNETGGVRVFLGCRNGLADFIREELAQDRRNRERFEEVAPAMEKTDGVELLPRKSFTLRDLLAMRCWSTLSFPLGRLPALARAGAPLPVEELARLAASQPAWKILRAFTSGPIRYRWEFPARRITESTARALSEGVHARQPSLLNDTRSALWEIRVEETPRHVAVHLLPRFRPDPRFAYRSGDVPAASHPPLAAAIARLSQVGSAPFQGREHVWDPFCGSGLELAECLLLDPLCRVYGTDLEAGACRVASANVESAGKLARAAASSRALLAAGDFRDALRLGIPEDQLTLILTNPPLGKRVPRKDLQDLMRSLFGLAGELLIPGGRLVLVNPCEPCRGHPTLKLEWFRRIDLGFAHFQLEKYIQRTSGAESVTRAKKGPSLQKSPRPPAHPR